MTAPPSRLSGLSPDQLQKLIDTLLSKASFSNEVQHG